MRRRENLFLFLYSFRFTSIFVAKINFVILRCREIDETDSFPEYREFWLKCGEQGVLGTLSAEEFGGTGMGLFETSLMLEELSRISGGVYMGIFAHTCLSSYVIERNGTAEQKAKFLPGLVSGQTIGMCF